MAWRCACGWKGRPDQMVANPSGGLCCPKCGGSGGLIRDPEKPPTRPGKIGPFSSSAGLTLADGYP